MSHATSKIPGRSVPLPSSVNGLEIRCRRLPVHCPESTLFSRVPRRMVVGAQHPRREGRHAQRRSNVRAIPAFATATRSLALCRCHRVGHGDGPDPLHAGSHGECRGLGPTGVEPRQWEWFGRGRWWLRRGRRLGGSRPVGRFRVPSPGTPPDRRRGQLWRRRRFRRRGRVRGWRWLGRRLVVR